MTGLGKGHCSHLSQQDTCLSEDCHRKQRITTKARFGRDFFKNNILFFCAKKLTKEKCCEKFMADQSDHPISKPKMFVSLMEEIEMRYLQQPIKIRLSSEITFFLDKYEITFSPL